MVRIEVGRGGGSQIGGFGRTPPGYGPGLPACSDMKRRQSRAASDRLRANNILIIRQVTPLVVIWMISVLILTAFGTLSLPI